MNRIASHIGIFLCECIIRIWLKTLRIRILNQHYYAAAQQEEKGVIFAFWHGRIFPMLAVAPKNKPTSVIVSRHGDGEFISRIIASYGFDTIRGSTNRKSSSTKGAKNRGGTQALLKATRIAREGHYIVVTPDGPKGPRMRVKPNMLHIATESNITIYPVSFSAPWSIRLKSWDRFMIPLPFSLAYICLGSPVTTTKETIAEDSLMLENKLIELTQKLDTMSGKTPTAPE